MALIKLGPLVTDVAGSIHNVTFSNSRAGPFIRTKHQPRPSRTSAQAQYRFWFQYSNHNWIDYLLLAHRIAWNELAAQTWVVNAVGKPYRPTGKQLFLGAAMLRLIATGARSVAVPDVAFWAAPHFAWPVCLPNLLKFTDDVGWSESKTGWIHIMESPPQDMSVNFYTGPYEVDDVRTIPQFHGGANVTINTRTSWIPLRKYFWKVVGIQGTHSISRPLYFGVHCSEA